MGNRISKTLTTQTSQLTTYYLRDATGNLIARYEQENLANINLKEFPLYGSSQLGTLETEIDQNATASNDSTFARILANKNYELKDYLGNVRAVVSDLKNSSLNASNNPANFSADITMTSDYYSYGMQMPGRSYQSSNYKYGFQGKEKDDDIKGEGNSYDFGARILDPRTGRWLSTDPLEQNDASHSTYCAMGDNPANMIDPNGMTAVSNMTGIERLKQMEEMDAKMAKGEISKEEYETFYAQLEAQNLEEAQRFLSVTCDKIVELLRPDEYDMAVATGALQEPTYIGEVAGAAFYILRRVAKVVHADAILDAAQVTIRQTKIEWELFSDYLKRLLYPYSRAYNLAKPKVYKGPRAVGDALDSMADGEDALFVSSYMHEGQIYVRELIVRKRPYGKGEEYYFVNAEGRLTKLTSEEAAERLEGAIAVAKFKTYQEPLPSLARPENGRIKM